MLVDIDKILVGDRIRKDFGNINELAEDIKANSLLNALVVTPSGEGNGTYILIAGERRLRACKSLGYTAVPVNTVGVEDAEQALMMEISENECRKEFTKTERLAYARQLARIESVKAQERIMAGKAQDPTENSPQGETREIVAKQLGTSSNTIAREQYIENNADLLDPSDFADWDEGKLSTNKAYQRIKAAQKKAIRERDEARDEVSLLGDELDEARREITELEKQNDRLYEQANAERPVVERKVEVVPKDYESLKRENERLTREYQQMWQKKRELDKRLEQANELLGEKDRAHNASRDIEQLTIATNNYLRNYGGKAWAFDEFDRVDEVAQSEFRKAITSLAAFAQNLAQMISDKNRLEGSNE